MVKLEKGMVGRKSKIGGKGGGGKIKCKLI